MDVTKIKNSEECNHFIAIGILEGNSTPLFLNDVEEHKSTPWELLINFNFCPWCGGEFLYKPEASEIN